MSGRPAAVSTQRSGMSWASVSGGVLLAGAGAIDGAGAGLCGPQKRAQWVVEPSAAGMSVAPRLSWQKRLEQLPELVIDRRMITSPCQFDLVTMVPPLGLSDGCVRELWCREP